MSLYDEGLYRRADDWVTLQRRAFHAELRAAFTMRRPSAFMTITGIADGVPPAKPIPLWTRHMLGVREAERYRRRKAKGLR